MKQSATKTLGLIAGMVVVLGGFGYLLYGNIGSNIVYFLTPKELLEKGTAAYDEPVRLGGMVKPGSVQWDAQKIDLRFIVQDAEKEIPVHSTAAPPAMFQPGQGVIVEGKLKRSADAVIFESTSLMVKHSNEYKPPQDGKMPQEMYKGLRKDRS